ncbi:antibiotic biosynthesis monooxygenase [Dactylosporangium sp. NPDC005572]|uniref:antibiotic biosynthesis monooxygenase family protein n=1 Tax=Dactylosporangium sp. NPDC005572 TaxID=3156889 RepID=UPI0033AFA7CA
MHVVISQAWTKDAGGHADAYVALSVRFAAFFAGQPGFRGRWLVRDVEDPTHFTHIRMFDTVGSYEAATRTPGYVEHTEAMYEHLRPYDTYPRTIGEVVLEDLP